MDEVSSETLTSASPTNDKSDKSIADIGGQKTDKEPVSALSKNDKEVEIKGDVESKKRDEKCRKMDHYALISFLVAYGITVFTYFTAYCKN